MRTYSPEIWARADRAVRELVPAEMERQGCSDRACPFLALRQIDNEGQLSFAAALLWGARTFLVAGYAYEAVVAMLLGRDEEQISRVLDRVEDWR